MFRLNATLVAMTVMRPWRTGWSVDRGVDFSLAEPFRPATAPPAASADAAPTERTCFIEEDWSPPADAAVVRTFVSAVTAEAGSGSLSEELSEAPPLRGWWSLSGKPPQT